MTGEASLKETGCIDPRSRIVKQAYFDLSKICARICYSSSLLYH